MLVKRRGVPANWLFLYVCAREFRLARSKAYNNGGYFSVRRECDTAELKLMEALRHIEEDAIQWRLE